MQLHAARGSATREFAGEPQIMRVLELMGCAIEEARTQFKDSVAHYRIRRPGRGICRSARVGAKSKLISRLVLGSAQQLHPVIRDEIIVWREALVNATPLPSQSHRSGAGICAKRFRLIVRDNGRGIDPHVLHADAKDIGDSGMRERAEKFGARLRVWSRTSANEIELSVSNR